MVSTRKRNTNHSSSTNNITMIPLTSSSAIAQLLQEYENSTLIPCILTADNRLVPFTPDIS